MDLLDDDLKKETIKLKLPELGCSGDKCIPCNGIFYFEERDNVKAH